MIDVIDFVRHRKSIRDYSSKELKIDDIKKIIDAARWAPSAHNLQPWEFTVVLKKNIISQTAGIMDHKSKKLLAGFNIIMKETAKKVISAKALVFVYSNGAVRKKFEKFDMP